MLCGKNMASNLFTHISSLFDEAPGFDSCIDLSDIDSTRTVIPSDSAEQLNTDPTIDGLMCRAYGESLLFSAGSPYYVLYDIHFGLQLFIILAVIILYPVALLVINIIIDLLNEESQYFVLVCILLNG